MCWASEATRSSPALQGSLYRLWVTSRGPRSPEPVKVTHLQPVSLVALMSREGPAWTAHSKAWSYLVTTVVELGGRGSQKSACKVTGEPGSAAVLCLWQVTRASQALTISALQRRKGSEGPGDPPSLYTGRRALLSPNFCPTTARHRSSSYLTERRQHLRGWQPVGSTNLI